MSPPLWEEQLGEAVPLAARVDTVLRYYERFLERFPTPEGLAAASEDSVMAAWSGLGYYRRALPRFLATDAPERFARVGEIFLKQKIPSEAVELVVYVPLGREADLEVPDVLLRHVDRERDTPLVRGLSELDGDQ
jgi:hypothetical protein